MMYTEPAPRWQQFHAAPAMVDIQKTYFKKPVTHVESHASAVGLLKRPENSTIKAIINQSIKKNKVTKFHLKS